MTAPVQMDAVVLAAGLGTRMAPISQFKPKPLVIYRKKPLICWTLDAISEAAENIHVVTRVFPEQFSDLPGSYKNLKLVVGQAQTMLGNLWEALSGLTSEYVFCGSSDVAYDESAVQTAIRLLSAESCDILVALKTNHSGGDKKWHWEIVDGKLVDIRIEPETTAYERFFLIARRETLHYLREQFALDSSIDPAYGQGWIYLLKLAITLGINPTILTLNHEFLANVNRYHDLFSN